MNRLVEALLAHPRVVDMATQREREAVPFDLLLEMLGAALLSMTEQEYLTRDAQIRRTLRGSYVPTITAPDWEGALAAASGEPAGIAGWWTVMIPASTGRVGLTVPQDSSDARVVALFTGAVGNARTLAYNPALGSLVDFPVGAHCMPPSRGKCDAGTCGGCRPVKVWDPATGSAGIRCRCRDQAE